MQRIKLSQADIESQQEVSLQISADLPLNQQQQMDLRRERAMNLSDDQSTWTSQDYADYGWLMMDAELEGGWIDPLKTYVKKKAAMAQLEGELERLKTAALVEAELFPEKIVYVHGAAVEKKFTAGTRDWNQDPEYDRLDKLHNEAKRKRDNWKAKLTKLTAPKNLKTADGTIYTANPIPSTGGVAIVAITLGKHE